MRKICIISLFLIISAGCKIRNIPKNFDAYSKEFYEKTYLIMSGNEKDEFLEIPFEGIRRMWIAQFWKVRDPDPSTQENEAAIDYYTRVAYADKYFRENGLSGHRTDRGRVLIYLGFPDQVNTIYSKDELQLELMTVPFLELSTPYYSLQNLPDFEEVQLWDYFSLRWRVMFVKRTFYARYQLYEPKVHFISLLNRCYLLRKIQRIKGKWKGQKLTVKLPLSMMLFIHKQAKVKILLFLFKGDTVQQRIVYFFTIKLTDLNTKKRYISFTFKVLSPEVTKIFVFAYDQEKQIFRTKLFRK